MDAYQLELVRFPPLSSSTRSREAFADLSMASRACSRSPRMLRSPLKKRAVVHESFVQWPQDHSRNIQRFDGLISALFHSL